MIRLTDAFTVAATKLRTHRVRTAIIVTVAGLLFGVIIFAILVVQGVIDSVEQFSTEGLNSRTLVMVSNNRPSALYNVYDHRNDPLFIAEVEKAQANLVARKTAAAKKYSVAYDAVAEDPNPITIDPSTKQKMIAMYSYDTAIVQQVALQQQDNSTKTFAVVDYVKKYGSPNVIQKIGIITPVEGQIVYMKDGKETADPDNALGKGVYINSSQIGEYPTLMIIEKSVAQPFIVTKNFDASKGEVPVIVPFAAAEKLLGYKPLKAEAPAKDKLERLTSVRQRIGEVTSAYCYRNNASQALYMKAITQRTELEKNKNNRDYQAPFLQYTVPDPTSCGAVTVAKDTRTADMKREDANRVLFEKELGIYIGEPVQQKIPVRAVGIVAGQSGNLATTITDIVSGMLTSSIGDGSWVIPQDLLSQLPGQAWPKQIFEPEKPQPNVYQSEQYLVEFPNKADARRLLKDTGIFGSGISGDIFTMPYGSGILLFDELKTGFYTLFYWVILVLGVIAVIILGGIIGRTIADGRRESAVFRAIGAKRTDIGTIYGVYAGLLALRMVVFALVLGATAALVIELVFWKDATTGARLAYVASDSAKEFHLFSPFTMYIPAIIAVIIIASLLAAVVPISLNARRNPINDMRDDA